MVAEAQPDGTARYRLLETLRQYARERLAAGGAAAPPRARHAAVLPGAGRGGGARRCTGREQARVARPAGGASTTTCGRRCAGCSTGSDAGRGLRLAWALRWFWEIRGHAAEGRRWLAEVLAHAGLPARPALHARALAAAGKLARARQDYGAARPLLAAGLDLYRGLGDQAGAAAAARDLGMATARAGDPDGGLAALGGQPGHLPRAGRPLGDRRDPEPAGHADPRPGGPRRRAPAVRGEPGPLPAGRRPARRGVGAPGAGQHGARPGRLRPGPRLVDAVPGPHGRPGPPPRHHDLPHQPRPGRAAARPGTSSRGATARRSSRSGGTTGSPWPRRGVGACSARSPSPRATASGRGPASARSWRSPRTGACQESSSRPPWRGPWAARPRWRPRSARQRVPSASPPRRRPSGAPCTAAARGWCPAHYPGSSTRGSHRPDAS